LIDIADLPDGRHGTLVLVPRDRYGNPLGPGRGDRFTVAPMPGVRIDGKVKDRGDGSYAVDVVWDVSVTPSPGVLVGQPDRDPVIMPPGTGVPPRPECDCTDEAGKLLDCLGLGDVDVKRVRIKSVSLEVDLKGSKHGKDSDC
jgi:hypothetical protein